MRPVCQSPAWAHCRPRRAPAHHHVRAGLQGFLPGDMHAVHDAIDGCRQPGVQHEGRGRREPPASAAAAPTATVISSSSRVKSGASEAMDAHGRGRIPRPGRVRPAHKLAAAASFGTCARIPPWHLERRHRSHVAGPPGPAHAPAGRGGHAAPRRALPRVRRPASPGPAPRRAAASPRRRSTTRSRPVFAGGHHPGGRRAIRAGSCMTPPPRSHHHFLDEDTGRTHRYRSRRGGTAAPAAPAGGHARPPASK